MPLLRRKKKDAEEAPPEAVAAESPDGTGVAVDEQPPAAEAEPEPETAAAPEPEPAPPPSAADTAAAPSGNGGEASQYGNEGPGYVDTSQPSVWVGALLDNRPPPSRDELDRRAAAEFQAAIAPSLDRLREAVPDASSPEEARRALEEREAQAEYPRDEEGDQLKGQDVFNTEASVHYRIQRHLRPPRRLSRFGEPWRPPADLARPVRGSNRPSLGSGD